MLENGSGLGSTFALFQRLIFQKCVENRIFFAFWNTPENVRVSKNSSAREKTLENPCFYVVENRQKSSLGRPRYRIVRWCLEHRLQECD